MAATSRYKFIVSPDSDPCLFDLEEDPFEMRNMFAAPASRETVRELARALAGLRAALQGTVRRPADRARTTSPGPPKARGNTGAGTKEQEG